MSNFSFLIVSIFRAEIHSLVPVVFKLPGKVEIKKWDKEYIRITTSIDIEGDRNKLYYEQSQLLERYDICTNRDLGHVLIHMPNLTSSIGWVKESLTFTILMPTQMDV